MERCILNVDSNNQPLENNERLIVFVTPHRRQGVPIYICLTLEDARGFLELGRARWRQLENEAEEGEEIIPTVPIFAGYDVEMDSFVREVIERGENTFLLIPRGANYVLNVVDRNEVLPPDAPQEEERLPQEEDAPIVRLDIPQRQNDRPDFMEPIVRRNPFIDFMRAVRNRDYNAVVEMSRNRNDGRYLMEAVRQNNRRAVRLVLENNFVRPADSLRLAVEMANLDIILLLIRYGVRNQEAMNTLEREHPEMFEIVLPELVNINERQQAIVRREMNQNEFDAPLEPFDDIYR